MAKTVAVINMKGGVGKSTLTVNMAWHFAAMSDWKKRVLVIDLDPQFNASQFLLGAEAYVRKVVQPGSPTVWDLFEQAARAPGLKATGRDLKASIQRVTTYVSGAYVDLIPSQIELSHTLKNPSSKEHLLASFIDDVEQDYDLILIDCAPTESVLTTAAYLTVKEILIPVKPEFLSTIGLPLIQQSLTDFAKLYRKKVDVAGVCFNQTTDYSPEENLSKKEVSTLSATNGWHVFKEEVPYSRSFPKGARQGKPIFGTSYSRSNVASDMASFCNAFAKRISL